jgi:NitT/TauT family transport system permease protein
MQATTSERPIVKKAWRLSNNFWVLYLISIFIAIALWTYASFSDSRNLLPPPLTVVNKFVELLNNGTLLENTLASLQRVLIGFTLGVLLAIPVGFLMGWYTLARGLIEPWVQFLRTIPPIALSPLVIIFMGIGESPKIFLIFMAVFLGSSIATFQGVRNVDLTLIKAAQVLGAKDATIFRSVVVPAAFPFILVGMRISLGSAWGTLVAAELIAAQTGLGQMMQTAALYFQVPTIMVGILMIGLLGTIMDRIVLYFERRLTGWQEKKV